MAKLKSLILLDLDHNKIESLPETLAKVITLGTSLTRLDSLLKEYLELAYNRLRFFPETVALTCPSLRYIGLDGNLLSSIPPAVGYLKKLEGLHLKGNPIKMIPPHVYHQGLKAVLQLLREHAANRHPSVLTVHFL